MTIEFLGERISQRAALAGVMLTAEELHQLTSYYELLAHWNERVNLTALI
jgi:16S rRNA G527 N7-methylase RsmG